MCLILITFNHDRTDTRHAQLHGPAASRTIFSDNIEKLRMQYDRNELHELIYLISHVKPNIISRFDKMLRWFLFVLPDVINSKRRSCLPLSYTCWFIIFPCYHLKAVLNISF